MQSDNQKSRATCSLGFQEIDRPQRIIEAWDNDILQFVAESGLDHRLVLGCDTNEIGEGTQRLESGRVSLTIEEGLNRFGKICLSPLNFSERFQSMLGRSQIPRER